MVPMNYQNVLEEKNKTNQEVLFFYFTFLGWKDDTQWLQCDQLSLDQSQLVLDIFQFSVY